MAPKLLIADLEPNDVPSAILYFKQCLSEGTWTKERAHSVLMLQDDPDELIVAINAVRAIGG